MPLQSGDKLGPYEILAPIGEGGMGDVYKARDVRLDRIVAIKQLKGQHLARFKQEARAIAALNHPNICTLHDVGPDYLVMEYIEGTPLRGPLPLPDALRFATQIAAALGVAHSKGILHRDLKPGNILVTASGVKLLDFGLAKLMTDSDPDVTKTRDGAILGTAAYMSPEQAQGKPLDERSDIFSFGAVFYEMLSGSRAFAGESTADTLSAVLRDDPAPLQSPASDIVKLCLTKHPAQRFQSIAKLRAALESISNRPVEYQPSIAVLPFSNMSADKENEYFSEGIAEEILNLLAKIPGLKVIARTSSFAFRGQEQHIRKIAERLNVRTILEGSLRRAGNRIRVTAQLINAADESHLWSERYDRDLTDIFAIQDEIGQAISEALKVRLAPRTQTVNIEAYQNYLKGQYYRGRYTPGSLAKAKECFEQALAIDPKYAPAYSGLALYYYTLASLGIQSTGEIAPSAKSAAVMALAIDPDNSEAHSVLGIIAALFDNDWKAAEMHFHVAISAKSVPPGVRYRYVFYCLLPLGRVPEAIEQSRLGLETDPLSMILHFGMVWRMYIAKQYLETIEYARRAHEIDPNFYFVWAIMGLAQLHAGFTVEAIASLKRAVELAPWFHLSAWYLAAAYHQASDRERSQELARKLAVSHGHTYGAATYYATTGDVDAMFKSIEEAYRQRDWNLAPGISAPFFDPYRTDPRFQALLAKINLV
jgi:eukaryotic-like serine/threonine-protein kinase